MDHRLVFLVGAPRSGTTLLARLLHGTPGVFATPEPHLLTPLLHQGWFERVERAPYDAIRTQQALRRFVRALPRGEEDYLDALRAYSSVLYGRALELAPPGTRWFVDKTPAYALVLEHLVRVFPHARYILLRRHPAAIFHSYACSFFGGDFEAARRFSPLLARYLPRLARLITEPPRHLHVLDFEVLVTQPERELARCCAFLDLPFEPRALSYQASDWPKDGPGDPMRIHRYHRPEPTRAHAWVARLAVDAPARRCVERQLAAVTDRDLETLGHPSTSLWDPLGIVGREPSDDRGGWSRYALERRALLGLRRAARHRGVRPWIERARLACEILLRDGFAPEESTGRSEEE